MSELLWKGRHGLAASAARVRMSEVAAGGALPVGVAASAGAIAAASGGYFPTAWGWSALAFLWAAAVALLVRPGIRFGGLGFAFLGATAAVTAWTFVSAAWSSEPSQSVLEGERTLVYLAAACALLAVTSRDSVSGVLGGLLAAIVAIDLYSLATRLFPDRIGHFDSVSGYRLATPLGYWNALGIYSVFGVLLATGFAARARSLPGRALGAASLLVVVPTLYFTFGRASWISLAAGLIVAVALDARRLQLLTRFLCLAPLAGLALWLASQPSALTHLAAPSSAAAAEGHRLAIWFVVLAIAAAAVVGVLDLAERRWEAPRAVRLAYAAALVSLVISATAVVFVRYGGPQALFHKATRAFSAAPAQTNGNLNRRLFDLSGNGRADLWRAAIHQYEARPLLGSGAGSFESFWLQHRKSGLFVRDAHNLYLETLAELGPIGLGLLVVMLGAPLLAALRARRDPLVSLGAGAYAAYLVHVIADWDWETPAVTLVALACGVALIAAARSDVGRRKTLSGRVRVAAAAAMLVLAGFAFVGLVGNIALSRSATAAAAGQWSASERQARRATRWAPWSADAWQRVGEAELALNRLPQARADLRRAIRSDVRNWQLWLDLASASRGRAEAAAFERASRLNPLSPELAQFRVDVIQGRF